MQVLMPSSGVQPHPCCTAVLVKVVNARAIQQWRAPRLWCWVDLLQLGYNLHKVTQLLLGDRLGAAIEPAVISGVDHSHCSSEGCKATCKHRFHLLTSCNSWPLSSAAEPLAGGAAAQWQGCLAVVGFTVIKKLHCRSGHRPACLTRPTARLPLVTYCICL
jgi:hypothetical protein